MPEFHSEPYLHMAGLTHKSALIAWGAFYFRVREREGDFNLVHDSDLKNIHPPRKESIGARSADCPLSNDCDPSERIRAGTPPGTPAASRPRSDIRGAPLYGALQSRSDGFPAGLVGPFGCGPRCLRANLVGWGRRSTVAGVGTRLPRGDDLPPCSGDTRR